MSTTARRFAIGDEDFLLDDEPLRIISGALHYFRVHPGHWADRIAKAREMGLNTIETYVAWNAHSPQPGRFDTAAGLDLGRFLDLIAAHDMHAIVRPGPYICAEWDNGGLPAWLFQDPACGIRSSESTYLAAVEDYFQQLAPIIVPRQISHGGPIILVQIENEYGAYGSDKQYLKALVELTRSIGIDVPLTTVDQPRGEMLENGGLPDLHKTGSFGSHIAERLATLRDHQPTGPLMCAEFWDGWFDSWGGHHHTTEVAETARGLDELLKRGASVNIYMFHGGTNFGFTNGANDKGTYAPIVTSYDYDAPLDEAGNPTAKYWAFREVIAKYTPLPPATATAARHRTTKPSQRPASEFATAFDRILPLWQALDHLGTWSAHDDPPTADALGHYQGFTLYRTDLSCQGPTILTVAEVRDRAQVFLDGTSIGVLARDHHDRAITLPQDAHGVLDLLVEDQGRVDYGPRLGEPKGLIGPIAVNDKPLTAWRTLPLNLIDIEPVAHALRDQPEPEHAPPTLTGPVFARAAFDQPDHGERHDDGGNGDGSNGDLFLDTEAWGKGVAWINGFCLGRYWSRGPQRTLYVPGPLLRAHGNELIILELQAARAAHARFVAEPDLGHTEL